MSRRNDWNRVLESEVARWFEMPCERLITELREAQEYQVEAEGKQFQVEVQLVENTTEYVHVVASVDDGSLPWSICPATRGFIKKKNA